ncbi:ABC transporter permease [Nocardioides pantholopis]|uniref:ABC transporter permease n=1 Tax=Nocardioides pantholopis TaxID=2483798 RepID=UPI0019D23313|nr:ABC transporter permease [Nocardioides pantholopis]
MSVAIPPGSTALAAPEPETTGRSRLTRYLLIGFGVFALVSLVRVLTGADDLTSAGALRAALVAAVPIALAGLGGLWSERAGVVNIGLEGMMIVGALGAGWAGYHYGFLGGILGALLFGLVGGVVHAVTTVLLGVDHIVSGVAINIIAAGLAAFLAQAWFTGLPGGGPTQSPSIDRPPAFTLGPIADAASDLAGKGWFLISDLAAVVAALTRNLSLLTVLALVLVVGTGWLLWSTAFGLRLRSVGEAPSAAETLGVRVYFYKFVAVAISGSFAGLGGAYLALVAAPGYQNGMTGGLGYIGLAAMIFGNWRPAGLLAGAALFGYTSAIQLRGGTDALHALLLVIGVILVIVAVVQLRRAAAQPLTVHDQAGPGVGGVARMVVGHVEFLAGLVATLVLAVGFWLVGPADTFGALPTWARHVLAALLAVAAVVALVLALRRLASAARTPVITLGLAVAFIAWFATTDSVPSEFTGMAPYVATLFVLAFASQNLRMPAADGLVYRKGSAG